MNLAIKNLSDAEVNNILSRFVYEYTSIMPQANEKNHNSINILFVKYLHEFLKDSDIYYNYFRYKENFFGEKIREWEEKGSEHAHAIKDLVFNSSEHVKKNVGNLCSLFVEKLFLDGFNYIRCLIEYDKCIQDVERPEEFKLSENLYFLQEDYLTQDDVNTYQFWIYEAYFNEINGHVNWPKYIKWASHYCGATNEPDFLFYDVIMAYWTKKELKKTRLTDSMVDEAIKNYEKNYNTGYLYDRKNKVEEYYE